jgi:hypothetical protein
VLGGVEGRCQLRRFGSRRRLASRRRLGSRGCAAGGRGWLLRRNVLGANIFIRDRWVCIEDLLPLTRSKEIIFVLAQPK